AGVPAHTAEQYLARLLRQGFSVAVCDQTEDSSQAKGLVKREVTRVVTPGTVLEENLLDSHKPNRLIAILPGERSGDEPRRYGIATADLAAGTVFLQELEGESALRSEFARQSPSECLLPEDPPMPAGLRAPSILPDGLADTLAVSRLKPAAFSPREANERVVARFSEGGRNKPAAANLKALSKKLPLAFAASGALVGYIEETFAGGNVLLSPPQEFDPETFLCLGESAIRSLELVQTLRNGSLEGSLLWAIDRTCSGAGSRVLREWLIRPLRQLEPLRARHDAVERLVEDFDLRAAIRTQIKSLADLERIAARLAANKATPRDLIALKETLQLLPQLDAHLSGGVGMLAASGPLPETGAAAPSLIGEIRAQLSGYEDLGELIARHMKETCSNIITEGGLINDGIDKELDRLRSISTGGKEWIASFQAAEAARSGIASLKVGYNRVFGYFIEISRANSHLVPKDYERRQTLTNAERYTTPELKEREAEVLGADEKICKLEQTIFLRLRDDVARSAERLHATGRALAELDALCSLAEVAHKKGHVRPVMSNSGRLVFEQMRHPVLEETLPKGELVPNDIALAAPVNGNAAGNAKDASVPQILLLTGPNMAGKSTYIRATALCTILAQMGAFVPAEKAEVGIVDRIFTRVGAADDLAGGRSTFMVEMTEVAEILAGCSDRSLVILDEVGRGTSTYDGVSLAWSIVEHLHQGRCKPRTLFATHYHELSALEEELPRVKNASASVKEWQGEITFLHRIVPGPSERSFGIHVARLAGVPASVLERAKAILIALEEQNGGRISNVTDGGAQVSENAPAAPRRKKLKPTAQDGQLQLFDPDPQQIDPNVKIILDQLRTIDPHQMTPLDALTALDKLVKKAGGS
ncbi:MAG TPA: DNA mismatch repair protein MutS, partial [Planctomycetota bacterium]|nr:DNA mismatch repair protein MutS [Planctomycetota bacterium]